MNTPLKPLLLVFGILFGMSISAAFMGVNAAHAATYYVAATGGSDSNPGTQASPFATLQHAHDVAVAGDTIYMRGGTYLITNQVTLTRNGASGNRITIVNYPGERPIIDGTNLTQSFQRGIFLYGGSWWHVKGIEVKNMPAHGIYLETGAHDNIVEFNNVHHNGRLQPTSNAIFIGGGGGGNNLLLNNDAHHQGGSSSGGDGIAVSSPSSGNVVRGNRVWRNTDDGIDLSFALGVVVEGNWCWENGLDDNLQKTSGNGHGFKLGLQAPDGGHTVRNNVAWNNAETGFSDNHGALAMTLINNTAWGNEFPTPNFQFVVQADTGSAHTLRNNLAGNPASVSMASAVHDHNSWDSSPSVTITAADVVSTDFTANLGARQADGSLPTSNFLKLVAGSDAIGKGVNVGLPFNGAAPDLGAYEFTPTACQPTTLSTASVFNNGGFAWVTPNQASFGTTADTSTASTVSTLRLFENATELGPAHALHDDIRNLGLGRFSHWSSDNNAAQSIRFSATDNTNVTTNGRNYSYTTGCTPSGTIPAAPANLRVVIP